MIERDYIMRMVRQLSEAIAKALSRVEQNQLPEAFHEIDDACQSLIGAPLDLLRSVSDTELISLLGSLSQADKLLAAAELLRLASRLHLLRGELDESHRQGVKAFSLYAELLVRHTNQARILSQVEWEALLQDLEREKLPSAIEIKRSRFYEIMGDLRRAMEILSELIERDPKLRPQGAAMGSRLQKLSAEELTEGGLSREAVNQWRHRWENSLAS